MTPAEEYIDIIDEAGNPTGEVRTYADVHREGLRHRTAHVWIVDEAGNVLLQKRSASMRFYPNHWDATVGGHIDSGETSREAALREMREEVGLYVSESALVPIGSFAGHMRNEDESHIENELIDVFVVRLDVRPSDLSIDAGEVGAVRALAREEFALWAQGKGEPMVPHHAEHEALLAFLYTK